MFKIKVIRADKNTQIDKKIYESTAKFLKYGVDYYNRKHDNSNNVYRTKAYCKCFKINIETEEWIEIDIKDYIKD